MCCYQLERYGEAERAVTSGLPQNNVHGGAAGLYLAGLVMKRMGHSLRAVSYFQRALEANPFLWSAYEALCNMLGSDMGTPAKTPASTSSNRKKNNSSPQQQHQIDSSIMNSGEDDSTIPRGKGVISVEVVDPGRYYGIFNPHIIKSILDRSHTTSQSASSSLSNTNPPRSTLFDDDRLGMVTPMVKSTVSRLPAHHHDPIHSPMPPSSTPSIALTFASPAPRDIARPPAFSLPPNISTPDITHTPMPSSASSSSLLPPSSYTPVSGGGSSTPNPSATPSTSVPPHPTRRGGPPPVGGKKRASGIGGEVKRRAANVKAQLFPSSSSSSAAADTSSLSASTPAATPTPMPQPPTSMDTPNTNTTTTSSTPSRRSTRLFANTEKKRPTADGPRAPEKKKTAAPAVTAPASTLTPATTVPFQLATPTPSSSSSSSSSTATTTSSDNNNNNNNSNNNNNKSAEMEAEGRAGLLALLNIFARAYLSFTRFRCAESITLFSMLPPSHLNTGWVQTQIARAYTELGAYNEARMKFETVRKLEPSRVEGMEVYSTVLWHLKRAPELSALATQLLEQDRTAPQSWVAMGNHFSLQREHATAIKMFTKAAQMDPWFAYAHTLIGHEYKATDNVERAFVAFRQALRVDPRHYNAWFGLAEIYFKQEKLNLAEYHYRRAWSINPGSVVIACSLGRVLTVAGKKNEALLLFNQALALDPRNVMSRFEKAKVLYLSGALVQAEAELTTLVARTPKEIEVYVLLGRVCQAIGDHKRAIDAYMVALDLDPKDPANIKSMIERASQGETTPQEQAFDL
eukprot:TRINITY_DN11483_c0_g1_i2.p1 TRINITY_DN11483_c0_g1~~TRINITY_DN11483_c0_g1_i2.p1  ORF type:complete len:882 (+),score=220.78 TRINITY_DN11483_c0_g1_i2:244-2646(+)